MSLYRNQRSEKSFGLCVKAKFHVHNQHCNLLYGASGTGKTSYALGLAQKLGIPAYEILREGKNSTSKRRTGRS
jgi:replication-associated recombination protein RarA